MVTRFVRDIFFYIFYCSEVIEEATLLLHFQKWDHPTFNCSLSSDSLLSIYTYVVSPGTCLSFKNVKTYSNCLNLSVLL